MSKAGAGVSPNKQSATGKVAAVPGKKIFGKSGVASASPKAPSLKPGQSSKITGR
jgi:hypothetical protein